MAARQTWQKLTLALALALALAGCQLPPINLSTDEPIRVDIDMRLDVYQHGDNSPPPAKPETAQPADDSAGRRKDREAEIQTFKNSRLVGERHDGLLAVLEEPAGEYGDQIRRTVARENADRMAEMKELANERKVSLDDVQREQAELWLNRSFSGEWIEVRQTDGSYAWKQKE